MTLQNHIDKWIAHLSVPQSQLDNLPICPYAKFTNYKIIHSELENVLPPKDDFELIIFVLPDTVQDTELQVQCQTLNQKFPELIFLPDPVNRTTYINEILTNNGEYNLILCQSKTKLQKARSQLAGTKYYTFWSPEYLKEITGFTL